MRASVGVALGFAVACGAVSMRAAADDVLVDVSSVTRSLPATFQGINYVGFWDSAQGSAASRDAIAQTGIKIVRFPGGAPADWYDWQCPYYTDTATPNCPSSAVASSWSSTSPLDVWNYANAFGGTVMFQTNFQGNLPNPPGQGYAVNSPENAAAWASYAQQQGMRALFEIGNEEDINMASVHDASFQPYITAFNAQAAAIHAADSSAQVIGPAGTNEYFWWALDSLGMFMAAAGNKTGTGAVDGVSLHFYTPDDWDSVVDTAQYWLGSGGPWEFIQDTIAEHDTRPLPVYISEWHVGVPEAAFNATMAAALLTADLIGAFAVSGVAGQQYFTTHGVDADPNSWGLLYGAGESRATDTPTPTYYATVMWGKMGSDVLALTQSGDPATGVSSYATQKSDGSVQVLSINKSTSDQTVNVTFSGFDPAGRNVAVYTLSPSDGARTSEDVNYNGVENPSVQALPAPTSSAVSGATWSQPLAASSMVLMDFEGDGSATGGSGGATGGAPATGGSSGSGATAGVGAAAGTLGSGGVGGGSGSGGAAAANAAGGDAADDGGCACVATGASPRATLTGWLMLAAVALFARGRSRHPRIRSSC